MLLPDGEPTEPPAQQVTGNAGEKTYVVLRFPQSVDPEFATPANVIEMLVGKVLQIAGQPLCGSTGIISATGPTKASTESGIPNSQQTTAKVVKRIRKMRRERVMFAGERRKQLPFVESPPSRTWRSPTIRMFGYSPSASDLSMLR